MAARKSLQMETALNVLLYYFILVPFSSAFLATGEASRSSFPISGDYYASSFSLMRASSLNDNGDFYIPGINDNEIKSDNPAPTASITGNYLSSLLDVDYSSSNVHNDNAIPDETQTQFQPVEQKQRTMTPTPPPKNIELSGLTEDGDFLMVGINAQDPISSSTIEQSEPSPISFSPPEAMINNNPLASFLQGGPQQYNSPAPIVEPTPSFPAIRSTISSYQDEEEVDEEQIGVVEEFLASLLPSTLNPNDLKRYAHGLYALGFDPDCEMSSELQYEDLDFMKRLHQRYFWKQWRDLQ